jgi:acetoin utilization deacetylase AcuC-like enzyme
LELEAIFDIFSMFPIIYSDEFLLHEPDYFHPEKPERLTAIVTALKATSWSDRLEWRSPTPVATRNLMPILQRVHDRDYIDRVAELANRGGGYIDSDTEVSPRTYEVALLTISAWLDAVDYALGSGQPIFALTRPPGHHALRQTGMGFCIFNNEAIAAYYALEQVGINRVAILDWDVHHGNGTQSLVQSDPRIAYCSLHQSPLFPGTGSSSDRGAHNNVLNIPMLPGSTIADYQPQFEQKVLPFLSDFQPDLLLVSAGYDATESDPLADINLKPEDYGMFAKYCLQVTHRIVFGLEGGYDLKSLAQSVVATIANCL